MFSNDSMVKLIINLIVYVIFQGLCVVYLLGLASKGSMFDFLQHPASIGDMLIIVGAGVYMLDELSSSKSEAINENLHSRLDKIETTIVKMDGLLRSLRQLKDNYN